MPDAGLTLEQWRAQRKAGASSGGESLAEWRAKRASQPFAGAKASGAGGWAPVPAARRFAGAEATGRGPELGTTPSLVDALATPTVGDHFRAPGDLPPPRQQLTDVEVSAGIPGTAAFEKKRRRDAAWSEFLDRETAAPGNARDAAEAARIEAEDPLYQRVIDAGLMAPVETVKHGVSEWVNPQGNVASNLMGGLTALGAVTPLGAGIFAALAAKEKAAEEARAAGVSDELALPLRIGTGLVEKPFEWAGQAGEYVGGELGGESGAEFGRSAGELALIALMGAAEKKGGAIVNRELAARRALANPDAGLLAARAPGATVPVEPSLASAPNAANARLVRGGSPMAGVRAEPPAPGGALPAPETALARPVPSGHYVGPGAIQSPITVQPGAPLPGTVPVLPRELPAPTGAAMRGLPDPMEFGRNPGVLEQPTITPAEAAQAAEVARLRGIPVPPGLFPSIEPPAPVPPRGPSFQEAQAARRSTPGPLPKAPEPVAPTATAPAAPPLAETVRIPHEAGAPVVETLPGAPLPPRFGAAQKPPAPPAPAPTTPIKPVEGVDTARFGAKGPKSEGTSVRPNTQVTLLPKEGTSVPFPEETRIRTQGGAAAEAGRTGRVVIRQADGLEAIVPPERAAEAQRLANEGKLAEIANGEGTSPKPAAPTEIVRAPGRDILVDTPEKRAAAVAANPRATVEPATPENLQKALAERQPAATGGEARQPAAAGETEMPGEPAKSETPPAPEMPVVAAEAPASPPSTSGTSTGRVERLRRDYADIKPGEEFDPFGTEGDRGRSTGYEVGARIVDEGGGKFAAEGAIGYGDDPFRLIGKGTLDEAKAHIARWADEQLRELEGQEAGAPKPVEAEVTNTAPKALPKPAEAPPSPSAFERRMQRGPQPRSSLDEANPTGDLGVDVPTMRASKLWDDPSYAPYGRDPKTGKRLPSDPHALDEAAWRAANEPEFAEPRFGERDPYPEATKASEQAPAAPSAPNLFPSSGAENLSSPNAVRAAIADSVGRLHRDYSKNATIALEQLAGDESPISAHHKMVLRHILDSQRAEPALEIVPGLSQDGRVIAGRALFHRKSIEVNPAEIRKYANDLALDGDPPRTPDAAVAEAFAHIAAHEYVHQQVQYHVANTPEFRVRAEDLRARYAEHHPSDYAATNAQEFMAEAISNKMTQQRLAKIKSPWGGGKSMLQSVKDLVSSVLERAGLRGATHRTLLHDTFDLYRDITDPRQVSVGYEEYGVVDEALGRERGLALPAESFGQGGPAPSAPDVPAAPPVAGSQEGGGAAAEQVLASAHRKMPPEWQGDPYEPDPIAQSILSANDRDTVLREIPPGSRYVDGGHEAIALETPDGKILRIGPARSEPRPNIPEMLQPESTKKVGVGGRWQIETLERADTKDITDADVQAMDDQLRTHGYELSDPGPDNLGRTTDGRLVVLDPGAVTKYEPGPSVPDVRAPAHSGRFGAKRPRATGEPGSVGTWPFAKMRVEPEAMQFKTDLTNVKTGETGALAHVQEPGDWRQAGEGVITLWRDPAHPELDPIVVDGHQRTAAGKRAGAPDPVVRFSEAKTADEAYVEGALLNMRGGTLTPGDAAMFFRRVGKKGDALRAYMKQELIPPKNVNVRRGQALANLSDDLWNAYRQKQLPEDKAVAIGMEDLTPAQQRRVAESDVSAEEVPEKANRVRNAPVVTKQSAGLFGAEVDMASLDDAATKIEKALKTAVKSEKGLYGSAASNATKLEKVGHIETDAAKQASAEAGTFHGVLEKLLGRTGPVNDAVMRAAAEVESGKMTTADAVRSLRAELPGVIRAAHPELADSLPPPSAPPAPKTPTLFRQEDTGAPKAPGTKKPFGRGESGSVGEVPPGGEPPPLGEMAKRTGKAIVEGYKTAGKALDFLDQRILGRGVTAVTKGGWGLAEKIPGVGRLFKGVKAVGEAITKPEGEHLGIDWADRRQRYTRDARLIQHDGAMLVSDFRKALKGTTPQERADVNAYMRSESETLPEGLSEKARRAIDDASNYVNILRDQEVELGTLSPEARTEYARYILRQFESKKPGIFGRRGGIASTERYDLARDAYGVRVKMSLDEVNALLGDTETTYRKQFGSAHDPETVVKFGRDEVAAAEREAFIEEVRQKYAGARSKLTADSTREIKAADVGQAKMLHKAQLDVPRLHDVVVEKFDPMSPEVEAQLKRVVEPGENLAATIMRSSNRIASARFLQRLAEDMDTAKTPDGRQIVVEPTVSETTGRKSVPAGYTILGDERWGPLQGKGVLTDHVEDLRGVLSIRDADGLGARLYDVLRMFNSGWKLTHTVLSPRTIFRQYPSNLEFLNNGGMHWAAPTFPFKVKRGMEIMADPRHPLHREAVANDLLGSTVLAKEELGVGTKFTPGQRVARAIGSGGLSELPDSVLNKASERYAHPDNVSKMTLYAEYRLDLGMSEEAAVREVRKWMPDPRNVSKAVRIASDMPFVSPFARFGVQSKTIGARAWRGRPIRAFTTALQKNIIRASIVALAAQLLGRKDVTPEQEDQLAGERGPLEMPLWQDENGNAISTDYRFLSTTGDVWPRVGKIGESGLWQYLGDFTGVSEAPVIDLVRTVIEGTDRYGRPLTHDRSATGKAMAAVEAYFRQVHPTWSPATGYHADAIEAAFDGKPAYEGAPVQTPAQAIISAIFGINMRPQEAHLELQKLVKQFDSAAGHAETDLINEPIDEGKEPDAEGYGERIQDLAKEFETRAGRFGAKKKPVEAGK